MKKRLKHKKSKAKESLKCGVCGNTERFIKKYNYRFGRNSKGVVSRVRCKVCKSFL